MENNFSYRRSSAFIGGPNRFIFFMSNLSFSREGRVARITLNRPEKRNALNMEMCRELATALEDSAADEDTGAILLAGSGSVFCAGMDLDEVLTADPGALHQVHEELFTFAARLAKPVVAAVHGAALGGGTGLVANCHVVVAAEDARFGLTEIRIGLWPFVVFRAVEAAAGERRAMEWSVTGRVFTAQEAWHAGLVHRVVPAAEVAARAGGNRRGDRRLQPHSHGARPRVRQPDSRHGPGGGG